MLPTALVSRRGLCRGCSTPLSPTVSTSGQDVDRAGREDKSHSAVLLTMSQDDVVVFAKNPKWHGAMLV